MLVRQHLLQSQVYDAHLAHIVESGSLEAAIFASKLIKIIQEGDGRMSTTTQFPKTAEAINRAVRSFPIEGMTGPTLWGEWGQSFSAVWCVLHKTNFFSRFAEISKEV